MQREAATATATGAAKEAARSVDEAEALAADARLLLEAGRPRGAALLHAEAATLLLRALGGDAAAGPSSLPRDDALATRFRAVWLDRVEARARPPGMAALLAMADGLRALVPAARARIAPEPAPARIPAADPEPPPRRTTRKPPPPAPAKRAPAKRAPAAPKPARPPAPPVLSPPDPQPLSLPAPLGPVSSAAFWSLMDRWGVGDADALALLGHAGGLTRRGTRPRFRLAGAEIARFHGFQNLDDALASLGADPRAWLHAANPAAPFSGAAPLATLLWAGGDTARRETILRDATRHVVGEGLRRSLG